MRAVLGIGRRRERTRPRLLFLLVLFSCSLVAGQLLAQSQASLGVTVQVARRFKIEVSTSLVSFTRSSSSGLPQTIPANEGSFELTIKTNNDPGSSTNVWLLASSDLLDNSTGYTIPVERISWTAQGNGFYPGHLVKATPVLVARFVQPGSFTGQLYFFFAEDPNFAPGNYQTTVTILVEGV
ncbi:MAG: hypothetical protein NUW07_00120 [Candidatus Saccharicenans sp.]|nr:hypothetical protein [Candidatus Saccharicenans sp.]MDH7493134.1 hypothetical protein [Candidatus Saccharicenans sp.]